MGSEDTHRLGYRRVDDDQNISVLLATMDATAGWEATRRLRAWERRHLRLTRGQRLLDVGCGLGDAAIALAGDLLPEGEVVGIDASTEMVAVARSRAGTASLGVRFEVGDGLGVDEANDHFDVVRAERTLQWLSDPVAALAEMVRVLRPGGLLSVLDSDWSTFEIDVGDREVARRVRNAMRTERHRPSNIGARLPDLVQARGLELVAGTSATQIWNAWDPDASPAPDGCFSMASLADDLVDAGQLDGDERERFVSTTHQAARNGCFSMALTMFAVVARAPTIDRFTPDSDSLTQMNVARTT